MFLLFRHQLEKPSVNVARFSEPKASAFQPSGRGRPEQAALGGNHYFDARHAARFRHCGRTRETIEPATCRHCAAITFSKMVNPLRRLFRPTRTCGHGKLPVVEGVSGDDALLQWGRGQVTAERLFFRIHPIELVQSATQC